ncbi:MAG: hypothetical protein HC841_04855 [Verrucomicrobiae bacterium]|nr:hypothetical protein [Verrucomicrobiae bacterium]
MPPKDLALAELKMSEREDICGVFEVDPILVGLKGVADPLSANSTFGRAEVAHIRGVTIPFLRSVVLHALNMQWAQRDFREPHLIEVDGEAGAQDDIFQVHRHNLRPERIDELAHQRHAGEVALRA